MLMCHLPGSDAPSLHVRFAPRHSTHTHTPAYMRQSGRSSIASSISFEAVPLLFGFDASMFAATTKSSAPLPGNQRLITSRDSGFRVTFTLTKPTCSSICATSSGFAAPETQQARASAVCKCFGKSRSATTSEMARRPPGFRTRRASR